MKFCLLFLLCCFCAAANGGESERDCADRAENSFYGVWESSYGHMFFTYRTSKSEIASSATGQGIRAAFWSYPDSHGAADNGRIVGTVTGNTLNGHWIQDSGDHPCATEKEGSPFWGTARFTANTDFTELTGVWGQCDEAPNGGDSDWILWRDAIRDWDPPAE